MNTKDTVNTFSDFLKSEDLANIIGIAEDIIGDKKIPCLSTVLKILKVLVKAQPIVESTSNIMGSMNVATDYKDKFKRLFDIAMDDGVITAEEKEILRPCAQKAGYSDEEFEMMVLSKKILH